MVLQSEGRSTVDRDLETGGTARLGDVGQVGHARTGRHMAVPDGASWIAESPHRGEGKLEAVARRGMSCDYTGR